ncbi:DUF6766 family protein [Streptomyces sp. NPDC048337]|uniref:DUF6766 family protein n=1 Tax=Streptomyces sp. NPDC048337 TaxID=3365535 RepID=UPI003710ADDD
MQRLSVGEVPGTVWLLQRGSPESKELHKAGPESDREQRIGDHARADSPRRAGTKSIAGTAACNEQQLRRRQRGSPESKPVGAPHSSTGVEG